MGIFRGTGGSGEATTDVYASKISQYANTATSKATEAAVSASSAATSATNASTSETNTEATYDAFDDVYLGSKTSNPTLDNDGDALKAGALYFNTTNNELKIYTGSSWQITAQDVSTYLTETEADARYEPVLSNNTRQQFFRQANAPVKNADNLREGDMWYELDTEDIYFWRETTSNVYVWELFLSGTSNTDTLDGGSY